jgi:CSLREA domain-containing protein
MVETRVAAEMGMKNFALAFAIGLCVAGSTNAAVLNVTRTDDPTPDGCTLQDCSLREAVLAANADNSQSYDVHLPAGTYQLNSRVDVNAQLYLTGAGAAQTRVTGAIPELFQTMGGTFHATDMAFDAGGNYVMAELSQFTLFTRVDLPNSADRIVFSAGDVQINGGQWKAWLQADSVRDFRINGATMQRVSMTIGVASGSETVRLSGLSIDGTLSPASDSGLNISVSGTGLPPSVYLSDCRILHTTLGALFTALNADGTLTIARTRYDDNDEPLHIDGRFEADIHDSGFYDNRAPDTSVGHTAALWISRMAANVTVERSTFSGNLGSSDRGGAVLVQDGAVLILRNSTFVNNSIAASVAALGARGGAIGFLGSADITALTMEHLTALGPTIVPQGLSGSLLGGDGNGSLITLSVRNSLLRGTCGLDAGALDTGIGNIESSGHSCGFSSVTNDNDVSVSALMLGTLGAHGGYTETFVPGALSAMLDAASLGSCADEDQRGYFRPYGAGCDVGAIERGDVLFANGFD